MLTVLFYFVKALLEEGVYSAITSPTTPLVYLLSLAVFVGMDDEVWDAVRRILPLLIIAYICLLIYEYIALVTRYGIVVVGNSSIIYFYVSLFWCTVIYLTDRILCNENIGLLQVLLIGFNIIFAVVINSRSWIIQSCIAVSYTHLFMPDCTVRNCADIHIAVSELSGDNIICDFIPVLEITSRL